MNYSTQIIIYGVIFLVQWFIGYGLTFARYQRKYSILAVEDYEKDMSFSIMFSFTTAFIPIFGFIIVFVSNGMGKYGFKLK